MCDINDIDEYKFTGIIKFDYRASGIADSDIKNNTVQCFIEVLNKIKTKIEIIGRYTSDFNIKLDFSENYLTDKSIAELYYFLKENILLSKHLISLNISNNHLTENSFGYIEKIYEEFYCVKINISSNNISLKKFRERFGIESKIVKFMVQ